MTIVFKVEKKYNFDENCNDLKSKMKKHSWKLFVSIVFLFVFTIKMGLSIAPLFFDLDKETVSAVILQLELETQGKDTNENLKDINKFVKKGSEIFSDYDIQFDPISIDSNLRFHTKARPYINSFYPSVLTPPPNFS